MGGWVEEEEAVGMRCCELWAGGMGGWVRGLLTREEGGDGVLGDEATSIHVLLSNADGLRQLLGRDCLSFQEAVGGWVGWWVGL